MDPYLFLPESISEDVASKHIHVLRVLESIVAIPQGERRQIAGVKIRDARDKQDNIYRASLAVESLTLEIVASIRLIVNNALTTDHDQRISSVRRSISDL